jgi:KDO2-lipid IV(A) lauroyltransferase
VRPLPAALPGERPVRHLNRALEMLVRECPGQYLWSYNRYKAPPGAPSAPHVGAPPP